MILKTVTKNYFENWSFYQKFYGRHCKWALNTNGGRGDSIFELLRLWENQKHKIILL